MEEIIIENNLKLISYFPNQEITLKWYQDLDVCKQVDNIDIPYTIERLDAMYDYLSSNGDCYYIEFNNTLVGDVSIFNDNEIAIVISKEFQNQHIGRKCINQMILLAKAKGIKELKATIFSFNTQSKKMFEAAGFKQVGKELYIYKI
ncbi:acetyltransferase, GNAT family [Peptoniphilus duerdenii ATCC BAA-1640]|uniref:Acetyltransferase, GNAT family n=1 Tax=Peptoniphilus duerdenii ATCC BAA-1640 TaxID=862517 RepID=E0NNX0_9FIRM|nr:GNAT family N-acetyltransferase [Peptoniphilus duerdenii]EFM24438.1 acetyltransferase, GNAT family [Peptoniphilus duerdenii ATCC BAA-1640]